jgi:hypothetical protein
LSPDFKSSLEAAYRRRLRGAVRNSALTRAERDVLLAFLNHWLHHRHKAGGVVHPGRARLAKAARVSERSVIRALAYFRDQKIITAVAHLKGTGRQATEYALNVPVLEQVCLFKERPEACKMSPLHVYGEPNVTPNREAKMSPRIIGVQTEKPSPDDNVIRLAFGGGCDV